MRFLSMIKSAEPHAPPPRALLDALEKLRAEGVKNGTLVDTGGLGPTATGTRIRVARGNVKVTDGPFTEAKEVIGGFAILEVKAKAEAVALTQHFMELHRDLCPGWEGEAELRQIFQ